WVTDGTAANTHEVTGINGAWNGSATHPPVNAGVHPFGLTAFGDVFPGEVVFGGIDAGGKVGLWATTGTGAGTFEIALSGAGPNGVQPTDLTAFRVSPSSPGMVLFNGVNDFGVHGLWAFDGTAGGTHELVGIPGAGVGGVNPSGMAVFARFVHGTFANEGLFDGTNASRPSGVGGTARSAGGAHEGRGSDRGRAGRVG